MIQASRPSLSPRIAKQVSFVFLPDELLMLLFSASIPRIDVHLLKVPLHKFVGTADYWYVSCPLRGWREGACSMALPTFISLVVEFVGGLILLFFGKQLFYFFIAIAGFTLGYLASVALLGPFGWPGLTFSLLLAAFAVGLAFVTRHLLVRLAGTQVGALTAIVVYSLLEGLLTDLLGVSGSFLLLPFLIVAGGVAGFLLSLRAFDLALMVLSSLL